MKPPPPLFSFDSPKQFIAAAKTICRADEIDQLKLLIERGLPPVSSVRSLALITGFSRSFLIAMAVRPHRYYRRFTIPKGCGIRTISSPKVALKIVQKWFGYYLSRTITLPDSVHGFVPGRSTVTAAKIHCPAKWILSVDIENFFDNVSYDRVEHVLNTLEYSTDAKRILIPLLMLNNALPQGSPASPVLANLAFGEADHRLEAAAAQFNVRLTRYADDVSCSSDLEVVPNGLLNSITAAITESGWSINDTKTFHTETPDRCRVLGLLVHSDRPRLPKRLRNRIKVIRYLLENQPVDDLRINVKQALGLIAYARSVV